MVKMIHPALLALTIALSSGCGSSSENNANPPPPATMANDVGIVVGASSLTSTAFSPNPKVVSLGGNSSVTVRWVNRDISGGDYAQGSATSHSIASDDGAFTPSGLLGGNATFSASFTAEGDYPYHCGVHPNMVGTVSVTP
jgi:plastocyanin